MMSNAGKELRTLAKKFKLPVTMTLQGLGAFPGDDPLSLGMLGMHGTYYANQAINDCDTLVALGARFDDRVTVKVETFASNAFKIHADIDPTAIDKNVLVDLPIVGDVKQVIAGLIDEIGEAPDTKEWLEKIEKWKKECPLDYEKSDGKLRTQFVIERISRRRGNA